MEKFYLICIEIMLDGEEVEVTTKFAHTQEKAQEVAELEIGDFERKFQNGKLECEDTATTMYRADWWYSNTIFVEIKEITEEDFEK